MTDRTLQELNARLGQSLGYTASGPRFKWAQSDRRVSWLPYGTWVIYRWNEQGREVGYVPTNASLSPGMEPDTWATIEAAGKLREQFARSIRDYEIEAEDIFARQKRQNSHLLDEAIGVVAEDALSQMKRDERTVL